MKIQLDKYVDKCIMEVEAMSQEEEKKELERMWEKWEIGEDFNLTDALSKIIEKGRKEGKQELKIEIIKKMVELNCNIKFISKVMELEIEEVIRIIENIKRKEANI